MCTRQTIRACLLTVAALMAVACGQRLPPNNAPNGALFYYPMSVAAPQQADGTLNGDNVYVVNINADQQFDTGFVTTINVPKLAQALAQDPNDDGLVRTAFSANLRIPMLGGRLAVSPDGSHAYLPHRGLGLLTQFDFDANGAITCGDSAHQGELVDSLLRTSCDSTHLIDVVDAALGSGTTDQNILNGASNYRDFQDPFAATVITVGGVNYVAVSYLSSAWVSVFNPAADFALRRNVNVNSGALQALHAFPGENGHLFGTSRKIDTTSDFSTLYDIDIGVAVGTPQGDSIARTYVASDVGGIDLYFAAFSPDGNRVFLANRNPDSVVAVANVTAPTSGIAPPRTPEVNPKSSWQVLSTTVLDSTSPSDLVYISRGDKGLNDTVAVAATLQDSVYFLTPRDGTVQVMSRLPLGGQGPFGMVHVKREGVFDYLLVATFFDHGLSVIDVSSPNVADFRELTHISESDVLGIALRSR